MQFVLTDRRTYINTIEFRNTTPILNVERLRSFREEGVNGNFTKKEFRYSFDNVTWSPWQTLNVGNFTAINFLDQQHFFIHVKYSRSSVIAGNISAFYITYDSPTPSMSSPDSSIIDADLLQGADASYYLDLANHFGILPFDKTYIDGSFNLRDVSIQWLNDNKSPIDHLHNGIYVKEGSLGSGFFWESGLLHPLIMDILDGGTDWQSDEDVFNANTVSNSNIIKGETW